VLFVLYNNRGIRKLPNVLTIPCLNIIFGYIVWLKPAYYLKNVYGHGSDQWAGIIFLNTCFEKRQRTTMLLGW